jgi:hypothetical protein
MRTVVLVFQTRRHTRRQRLVDAAIDHRPTEPEVALKLRDRDAAGIAKQHLRSFDLAGGRFPRSSQCLQHRGLIRREHQSRTLGFPRHGHPPSRVAKEPRPLSVMS